MKSEVSTFVRVRVGSNRFNTKARYDSGRKNIERAIVSHAYTDYSAITSESCTYQESNLKTASSKFPEKLYKLIMEASVDDSSVYFTTSHYETKEIKVRDIIVWQEHGRAFIIRHPKMFAKHLLGRHFKTNKYRTFQRQLNLYGFKHLTNTRDKGSYYHEMFLRGYPHLCGNIERVQVNGNGFKPISIAAHEPNFYSMPSLPFVHHLHKLPEPKTKLSKKNIGCQSMNNDNTVDAREKPIVNKRLKIKKDHENLICDKKSNVYELSNNQKEIVATESIKSLPNTAYGALRPEETNSAQFYNLAYKGNDGREKIVHKMSCPGTSNARLNHLSVTNYDLGIGTNTNYSDISSYNYHQHAMNSKILHERAHYVSDVAVNNWRANELKEEAFLDCSLHSEPALEIMSCFCYDPIPRGKKY